MNLKEQIEMYKRQETILPREEKILDTIKKSKEAFYKKEQERMLTYMEFLWSQFKQLKKRWWLFQMLLLATAGLLLPFMEREVGEYYVQRSIGVIGVLFVVLIIPELWKNRDCFCMEIEAAAYYTLKQIYAARLFLFGMVDVLLLTLFCGSIQKSLYFTFWELLVQFLFPMAVTACICFGMLCNKYAAGETVSVALCFIWSGIWWFILLNEKIYEAIIMPLWLCLFGMALLLFGFLIYTILKNCNQDWEVTISGIKNH